MVARPVVLPWETPKGRRPTRAERDEAAIPQARADYTMPQFHTVPDTGCNVHSSCFTCPLAECIFETGGAEYPPHGRRGNYGVTQLTAQQALRLREQGALPDEIAAELGCGRRTVFRLLRIARGERA